jgi:alpha-beta hydrolase superfamily lysophospholipase
VVLLVHGIAEHSGRYEHVARQFVAAGISVVGFDQRGHGETTGRRGHVDSFATLHADVERHLGHVRTLGLPTILLGHSMGGLVAASYGLSERSQPDLVLLSAPALALATPRWTWRLLKGLGRIMPRVRMKLLLKTKDLSADPRVGEDYRSDPSNQFKISFGLLGAMAATVFETEPRIAGWQHRTMVIHGLADRIVPPSASEPIGEVAGVDRRAYPDLRHELFNETVGPQVVADVLSWFDAALDAPT